MCGFNVAGRRALDGVGVPYNGGYVDPTPYGPPGGTGGYYYYYPPSPP